jgi:hypothetical protein
MLWERMFHWGFRSAEMQHRASLDTNIFYLDTNIFLLGVHNKT